MITREEGRTRFFDGMRVAREHLDHLQEVMLVAAIYLRQTLASGKVCYGLKVESLATDRVKVGPGLAFDRQARPLALEQEGEVAVDFSSAKTVYLVLNHLLRAEGVVKGIPTLLFNDLKVEARTAAPPYQDDAVIFAELHSRDGDLQVIQKGEWYLPPLDHGHSGQFLLDQGFRWRYDGHPLRFQEPRFDSGFVPVPVGDEVRLVHGLKTTDLLVQVQGRLNSGIITVKGLGQDFWYELVGDQEIRLVRSGANTTGDMDLRVVIWPFGEIGAGPILPMADAGDDMVVESGRSFTLDGSKSRAFEGRQLSKYIWTQLS